MKYLYLMWAALIRRKVRTIFTLLSVVAAFLLFGLLDSVRGAFANAGQNVFGIDRLVIISKVSPFVIQLPKAMAHRVQAVPGVTEVTYGSWMRGFYQDAKNFLHVEAHAENYFDLYPEWQLPPAQREALIRTRTGAVVEEGLARKFNWKIGDKIPLQLSAYQKNGSNIWTFDLMGIYRIVDPNRLEEERALFFNWDFFDKARVSDEGTVGWYILKIADPLQADRVAQDIDALSANSDHETKTESENEWARALVKELGDIGLIVGSIMSAVFFTLILLTGNTMSQAVRERIPELATLKTIGFTGPSILGLVLGESVLLVLLGSTLGLGASMPVAERVRTILGHAVPTLAVNGAVWVHGLAVALLLGLVVGALPAVRGMRLRIADALSGR